MSLVDKSLKSSRVHHRCTSSESNSYHYFIQSDGDWRTGCLPAKCNDFSFYVVKVLLLFVRFSIVCHNIIASLENLFEMKKI